MLKKRIIPCLDIQNGRTVKGVNFLDIRDAGDPIALAERYAKMGADELVLLDIAATIEGRKTRLGLVEQLAKRLQIPFTVGGGINCVQDVSDLLSAGADKISLNSAAIREPVLIESVANVFGRQCVVVAIDAKLYDGQWEVYINGGTVRTAYSAKDWAKLAEKMGAGELLLTSMSHDGTQAGFALDLIEVVSQSVNLPIIASGGAGGIADFKTLFNKTQASAGLAASIFHDQILSIPELKSFLKANKIPVRI